MTKQDFKKWRINLGFTQEQLALKFELTRNTIQNYESGFTKIPKCVELACLYVDKENENVWT